MELLDGLIPQGVLDLQTIIQKFAASAEKQSTTAFAQNAMNVERLGNHYATKNTG